MEDILLVYFITFVQLQLLFMDNLIYENILIDLITPKKKIADTTTDVKGGGIVFHRCIS